MIIDFGLFPGITLAFDYEAIKMITLLLSVTVAVYVKKRFGQPGLFTKICFYLVVILCPLIIQTAYFGAGYTSTGSLWAGTSTGKVLTSQQVDSLIQVHQTFPESLKGKLLSAETKRGKESKPYSGYFFLFLIGLILSIVVARASLMVAWAGAGLFASYFVLFLAVAVLAASIYVLVRRARKQPFKKPQDRLAEDVKKGWRTYFKILAICTGLVGLFILFFWMAWSGRLS